MVGGFKRHRGRADDGTVHAARAGGMDCAIVGTAPMPFEPTYHMQDVTKLPGTIL